MRKYFPIFLIILLIAVVFLVVRRHEAPAPPATTEDLDSPTLPPITIAPPDPTSPATPVPPPAPAIPPALSVLAEAPDWTSLEKYQNTITRSDFEKLLTDVFTTDDTWRDFITLTDIDATIVTSGRQDDPPFILKFASEGESTPVPRSWQSTATRTPPAPGQPLSGLHIAIDPGHLGGEWARIEERWFQIGDDPPVTEGDMTLQIAKTLEPLLTNLGARVTLVRTSADPVTPLRPVDLMQLASNTAGPDPAEIRNASEKLFYRTAEIRARADLVNRTIKPDLVLCLHFNAEGWGDPAQPTLVPRTHFHILVNGAYTANEVALADQRFAMLEKLLQRTHAEEVLIGKTVATTFAEISQLPAYSYQSSGNVRPIPGSDFLYARNLLANRLYDCPVLFMEPYVMNSSHDYARIQAGDYDGVREVDGTLLPSIFREYATALAKGLSNHYTPK